MSFILILSIISFFVTFWVMVEIALGIKKMTSLKNIQPLKKGTDAPRVSVIVPACNEENTIEPALLSLIKQDYDNLEIIVVNDRSTDATEQVLEQIKLLHPCFTIHKITKLPAGWLGKCHALYSGAKLATGEYLLFTDADVIMERTTISRAMAGMLNRGLDHLSLIFKNITSGGLLNAMILDAGGGLLLLFKPWKVNDPKSRYSIGVGAFNMVKTAVYKKVGGHEAIKMHPIDDIMLGKLIKENGFRQDSFLGHDLVTVRWYETPAAMINGLMKNIFALFNFRISYVLVSVFLVIIFNILPFWAFLFTHGLEKSLFLSIIVIRLTAFAYGATAMSSPVQSVLWSMLTPYINIYIVLKATIMTLKNNGINWRGTYYPLKQLKQNTPIL